MEPSEMHEFAESMESTGEHSRRDGEGLAGEAPGEQRMMRVSVAISILAVLVAMVTVLGHREHTEAVLVQARATDLWNEYQARRLRVQQLSTAGDLLLLLDKVPDAAQQAKLAQYRQQMAKWTEEVHRDQELARERENEVAVAERRAARLDLSEALLQIAVVLASITLLTRRQAYVVGALLLGVAGVVIAVSAWLIG